MVITEVIQSFTETKERVQMTFINEECNFSIGDQTYVFKISFLDRKIKKHLQKLSENKNYENNQNL